jgi:hypothetical protein
MSRRKRSPQIAAAVLPVGPDLVVEPIYESDPDGRPVVHHRVVDTLGRMLRNGSITREMHDAARETSRRHSPSPASIRSSACRSIVCLVQAILRI